MIGHIPKNTRIFIGLAIITLLLTYLAIFLTDYNHNLQLANNGFFRKHMEQSKAVVDTSDWKKYDDDRYPLSFLVPKDWKVDTDTDEETFYTINLDVPNNDSDISIYVSTDGFLGLEGLQEKPYSIGTAQGRIINGGLIGVKAGEYYYTFDGSLVPEKSDEFATILSTVKFQ